MSPGHLLLTLYRSLTRHRLYAALNILGLAAGIAVFLVLWLDVRFETGFERWIPSADQIYLVRTYWTGPLSSLSTDDDTMGGFLDQLRADHPQLVGTRMWKKDGTVRHAPGPAYETFSEVDPSFFQVFDLPLAAGDKATALGAPDALILSRTKANTYFGTADPIGRTLTLAFDGAPHIYRVTGVLKDPPPNTELKFDFLIPLQAPDLHDRFWRNWGSTQVSTYLRFADPVQTAALDAGLDSFVDRHAAGVFQPVAHKVLHLRTLPLLSFHLLDPKQKAIVVGLDVVGLLTLVLAGVNYMNLATARAGLRAQEVAIRKVMGATEAALVVQFMSEAVATALLAAILAIILCSVLLPFVNTAWGLSLGLDYLGPDGVVWAALCAAVVLGLAAGAYPALVLSRSQPAAVLAAAHMPGGGRKARLLREGLVAFQFAVATTLIAGAGVVVAQTSYLRRADIGFKRDGLIVVRSIDDKALTDAQRVDLIARWKALPGVVDAALSTAAPGEDEDIDATEVWRSGAAGPGRNVNYVDASSGFLHTYGARLIAGRGPDPASPGVAAPPSPVGVLNAGAVSRLGFTDAHAAIGQALHLNSERSQPLTIVGVVDDIRFHSPRAPVPPTLYRLTSGPIRNPSAAVRYGGQDARVVLGEMAQVWRQVAPTVPFRARTGKDSLQDLYRSDDQHDRLFVMGAILTVWIGCLGLYGLASFTITQRAREIGIRKALGASTADILGLVIAQFLRPVLLANLIAWPLAWLAMRSWLSGFDERIALSPAYLLMATVLTLAVALAAVVSQAYRVARANPAKTLRYE